MPLLLLQALLLHLVFFAKLILGDRQTSADAQCRYGEVVVPHRPQGIRVRIRSHHPLLRRQ